MDYHPNSLEDKLKSGKYELQDRIRFCFELCSGLEYLRSMRIAHGDLHPGNVMIKADGSVSLEMLFVYNNPFDLDSNNRLRIF